MEESLDAVRRELAVERSRSLNRLFELVSAGGDVSRHVTGSTPAELEAVAARLLAEDPIALADLLASVEGRLGLSAGALRRTSGELYRLGYAAASLRLYASSTREIRSPAEAAVIARRTGEIAVMRDGFRPAVRQVERMRPRADHVLHVVGHAVPFTQSGYTMRTRAVVATQRRAGLQAVVACQVGESAAGRDVLEVVDGVVHHFPGGPTRGEVPLDVWLEANVDALLRIALQVRPAVLHAHSDFVNAVSASVVAQTLGIPWVYEVRGFWEESWLSRVRDRFGAEALAAEVERHGLPDLYGWRVEREAELRGEADRVFTLAETMVEHIVSEGPLGAAPVVVPNAADPLDFPVVGRDDDLAATLGVHGATVVGYVSSMVEYEGVDVLLRAFRRLLPAVDGAHHRERPLKLLLVGEGATREALEALAAELGISDSVVFTGRVPQADVLRYYGLIDVFVVPRRPSRVCELVTPLKPYEAMSTGRCVVVSDVAALREIADASRATAIFRAGDDADLAVVLGDLLEDPQRRRELGAAAAAWTRSERTWSHTCASYLPSYAELGVRPRPRPAEDHAPADDDELSEADGRALARWVRAHSAQRGLPLWQLPAAADDGAAERADQLIGEGWSHGSRAAVELSPPVDWDSLRVDDRSWRFHLQTWDPVATVLAAHIATGRPDYLEWCVDVALSWARRYARGDAGESQAWYDMALGMRSEVLGRLIQEVVASGQLDDIVLELADLAVLHGERLSRPEAYNPRTNHGFFTAIGQLELSRASFTLPGMAALAEQGRARLREMVAGQFGADGGHLEHSPSYHLMLLDGFRKAIDSGLIDDETVLARVRRAERVAPWFVQPDGSLLPFGDTSEMPAASQAVAAGEPLPRGVLELRESGFAVVRTDEDYLAVQAGFHSRAHKHCDDLSVVWWHDGVRVLVDGGRYGYGELLPPKSPLRTLGFYYASDERQYVEGAEAHSTVRLRSRDHDRRRSPYGSGLVSARADGEAYVVEGAARHATWSHERTVRLEPRLGLTMSDAVSWSGEPEDIQLGLLLDGDLHVEAAADGSVVVSHPEWSSPLTITHAGPLELLAPVRGGRDPLLGWRSPRDRELVPAWSVRWVGSVADGQSFTTRLRAEGRPAAP